ncbi:hypothetical protein AAV94_12010 [Lampropedia cohaerens]|uniref:HTH tetR-type domain-containing protein n=1 Tax=Lampropedia cohaerens TaxID=1610491 RepID=A0A0U1PXI5_9BURK|nr:TetR family transcriptional regulator [Lampropedia cohaerens]KKW67065.1 hypothetical protein AAV94_12010 [Lampropedia cohaerens]
MARRTKEDALKTREDILDAAERLFERDGVSRTTLQAIAAEAGITRGAIYWHFKDKADLFNAMMDRIAWPIEWDYLYREDQTSVREQDDPIGALRAVMLECVDIIARDAQVQRLLSICSYQTEYTGEMAAVRQRMLQARGAVYARNLAAFRHPRVMAALRPGVQPEAVARTMQHALMGMIDSWVLTPGAFDLREATIDAIDLILHGAGIGVDKDAKTTDAQRADKVPSATQ